jgi:hypothetical protein
MREDAAMPESIGKIGDVGAVPEKGTAPAKKRVSALRQYHYEDDHDTVIISDEARRRALTEEEDELSSDER